MATSQHFPAYELICQGRDCCGGENRCTPELLQAAEDLRAAVGHVVGREVPLIVISGTRCAKHNKRSGGAPKSSHVTGEALDVRAPGVPVRVLEEQARNIPAIRGIGRSDRSNMLHFDVRGKPGDPLAVWCYDKSGKWCEYFPPPEAKYS